jgi:hypothetical protein
MSNHRCFAPTTTPWTYLTATAALLLTVSLGCASTALKGNDPGSAVAAKTTLTLDGSEPVTRLEIESNSITKRVRFLDPASQHSVVMRYKGVPVSWSRPVNLIVDEDLYRARGHRVRYRFRHPATGEAMRMIAHSTARSVLSVPIRTAGTAPVVELYADGAQQPRGFLQYDYRSTVPFSGQLEGRAIEIERLDEARELESGVLGYLAFPFPLTGEFLVRIDGQEVARFAQHPPRGNRSFYDLTLRREGGSQARQDALLAWIVFDLMKDFVD